VNRHRTYYPLDDAPVTDGDGSFIGVNSRDNPSVLPDGFVADAVNMRFDDATAATRKGVRIQAWGAQGYQGYDPAVILPYGDVRVAETFADPIVGYEWLAIVTTSGAFKARPGTMGSRIPLVPGESTAAAVDLIQTYNGMVMLRGPDARGLYMEDLDSGWRRIPDADEGKEQMPPSSRGIYFQNRLFLVDGRDDAAHADSVWVSDFGGVSSVLQGSATYNSFRINQGSSDRLRGIAKFNETTLVAAKSRSIYVVSSIYGDNESIRDNARLDEVTRQYGCIAPRSFVQVGSDLWFLGHRRGICSLRMTETNAMQGVDVPVSRDIQSLIDRINWEHAEGAVAIAHDNRVFFAVPIDGATYNNAIIVFSTLRQAWAGYDTGDAISVRSFVRYSYAGAVRVGFVTTTGYVTLYEDGYYDHVGSGDGSIAYRPIASRVRSRGYGGRTAGLKRFQRLTARIRTWNPAFTISVRPDGVLEERTVSSVTRSNTRYVRPHGRADWDPSNAVDDFLEPGREDYATKAEDVKVTTSGGEGTVAFDMLQDWEESRRIHDRGHALQVEIASTRGRIEVAGLTVDAIRGDARTGGTT